MSHLLPKYVRSQSVRGLTHLKKLVCVPKKGSRAEKLVVLGPPKNYICVGPNAYALQRIYALDDETPGGGGPCCCAWVGPATTGGQKCAKRPSEAVVKL